MSYLESILNSTKDTSSRRARTTNVLSSMMQDLEARKQSQMLAAAAQPQPQAPSVMRGAATQHHMGDGHDHSGGKGLDGDFNRRLSQLIKDSGGKIKVGSGYRSIAEQTKIYNLWKAGKHPAPLVAKPGSSNHNYGLAADLQFLTPAAKKFAHQNAAKYGLRFPMGNEPWHIEPVDAKARRKSRKK